MVARGAASGLTFIKTVACNEVAYLSCGTCIAAKFKASDTLTIQDSGCTISGTAVHYMVVAGGAGGGNARNGGGAAGGLRTSFDYVNNTKGQQLYLSDGPYAIVVGGGGSPASNGSNSSFGGIVATGGGTSDQPGGSGGGTSCTSAPTAKLGNKGLFLNIEGNNGGLGNTYTGGVRGTSGGGGGATGVGGNAPSTSQSGTGGVGLTSSITGSSLAYAGGGGGGTYIGATGGAASPCGTGGKGATPSGPGSPSAADAGTTNRGGGGGGGYHPGSVCGAGAAGGPGVVVVRIPGSKCMAFSPSPAASTSTLPGPAGGCKVAVVTANTTLTLS